MVILAGPKIGLRTLSNLLACRNIYSEHSEQWSAKPSLTIWWTDDTQLSTGFRYTGLAFKLVGDICSGQMFTFINNQTNLS